MKALFSFSHILAMMLIVLICIIGSVIYKRMSDQNRNRAGLGLGITMWVLDIIHYFIFSYLGELSVNAIPLHLCAMAVYVCLFHSVFLTDFLEQVLYDLCLPGAWCAILFPDWIGYPTLSYMSIHSYAIHGLVVIYITMQLASLRIKPRLSAIWKPILFLCITVPIAAIANHLLETNFMFISYASPGSPLEWLMTLARGNHAIYLILFGLLAVIVMTLMYLPYVFNKKRQQMYTASSIDKRKKSE